MSVYDPGWLVNKLVTSHTYNSGSELSVENIDAKEDTQNRKARKSPRHTTAL